MCTARSGCGGTTPDAGGGVNSGARVGVPARRMPRRPSRFPLLRSCPSVPRSHPVSLRGAVRAWSMTTSAVLDQPDELLPCLHRRPVVGGQDVQLASGRQHEHRHPGRTEPRLDVRVSIRPRRCHGHDDLTARVDPGEQLVVIGGLVEQNRPAGVEVRGPPAADG